MQRRLREVVAGQRFQKLSPGGGIWEVLSVAQDPSGTNHVRLKRLDETRTYRTIAVTALLDPKNYKLATDG